MPKPNRRLPVSIRIAITVGEREELRRASDKANISLSTLVRVLALAAVRRGDFVSIEAKAA